jgi:hypothetical protein
MNTATFPLLRGRADLSLLVVVLLLVGSAEGLAQTPPLPLPPVPQPDLERAPIVPADLLTSPSAQNAPGSPAAPNNRIRLFRIQPGFMSDPPGLDADDKTPVDERTPQSASDSDQVSVAIGNDNPFFDFRRPTDPGGVGFTRVNTQVQLFDTNRTACSLGFQAVTPAGLQSDGLADKMGTTVVTPALSLFHTLDDNTTALQAYVGKHLPLMNSGPQLINRDLQCGLALQRPLTPETSDPFGKLYLSVGALGQVRTTDSSTLQKPVTVEMLPGLHYKMAENWWISGAVVLPVSTRTDSSSQRLQVTCSIQF